MQKKKKSISKSNWVLRYLSLKNPAIWLVKIIFGHADTLNHTHLMHVKKVLAY